MCTLKLPPPPRPYTAHLGTDVVKSKAQLVFVHDVRWDLLRDDLVEDRSSLRRHVPGSSSRGFRSFHFPAAVRHVPDDSSYTTTS